MIFCLLPKRAKGFVLPLKIGKDDLVVTLLIPKKQQILPIPVSHSWSKRPLPAHSTIFHRAIANLCMI